MQFLGVSKETNIKDTWYTPGRLTWKTCRHGGLVQIIFLSKWALGLLANGELSLKRGTATATLSTIRLLKKMASEKKAAKRCEPLLTTAKHHLEKYSNELIKLAVFAPNMVQFSSENCSRIGTFSGILGLQSLYW